MEPSPPPVDPKPIWQSRTLWLNVIGLLLLAGASPEIVEIIPAETRPYLAAGLALLNIVNRVLSQVSPLTLAPVSPARKAALRKARSQPDGPLDPHTPNEE